jgi:hypothetical protein
MSRPGLLNLTAENRGELEVIITRSSAAAGAIT